MRKPLADDLQLSNETPEQAMLEHLPMVRFVARQIHRRLPKSVEIEDLCSAGVIGLLEAFAKFDAGKKVRFASYAYFRVRGAIIDSLRALDWAPRQLRQQGRGIQEAVRTLTSRLGHAPSEDQIACEMKITLYEYQKLLGDLNSLEIGSLHRKRQADSDEEELVYVAGRPEDDSLHRFMKRELADRLIAAIKDLPERERLVTTLYYYEDLTRIEIGLLLGIDTVKVSQIRASAVIHLRTSLAKPSLKAIKTHKQLHLDGPKNPTPQFAHLPAA